MPCTLGSIKKVWEENVQIREEQRNYISVNRANTVIRLLAQLCHRNASFPYNFRVYPPNSSTSQIFLLSKHNYSSPPPFTSHFNALITGPHGRVARACSTNNNNDDMTALKNVSNSFRTTAPVSFVGRSEQPRQPSMGHENIASVGPRDDNWNIFMGSIHHSFSTPLVVGIECWLVHLWLTTSYPTAQTM